MLNILTQYCRVFPSRDLAFFSVYGIWVCTFRFRNWENDGDILLGHQFSVFSLSIFVSFIFGLNFTLVV